MPLLLTVLYVYIYWYASTLLCVCVPTQFDINPNIPIFVLTKMSTLCCDARVRWLQPLLQRIKTDYKIVVTPIIDLIDEDSFEYNASPVVRGGFNWGLTFRWKPVSRRDKRSSNADPISSPTMAGGLFSTLRVYVHTHAHTHTRIHARARTDTHTHTPSLSPPIHSVSTCWHELPLHDAIIGYIIPCVTTMPPPHTLSHTHMRARAEIANGLAF